MSSAMTIVDDRESMLGEMVSPEAAVSTAIQLMAAMVDKRISTARRFPRSVAKFKTEAADLLRDDLETAKSAEYAKPVSGGVVRGPSVRLAEIALLCWGNVEIEVGEPVVSDKSVFVKATAWDLERNTRQDGIATTSIIQRNGSRYPQHLIDTACLATAAKARRNSICAIIPRAYIKDLLEVAKKVSSGAELPLEKRRQNAVDAFGTAYKVKPEQIFAYFAIAGIDDITSEHLDDLTAIRNAIKDGEAKVDEFFPAVMESKTEALKQKIEERRNKGKDAPKDDAKKPDTEDRLPALIAQANDRGVNWLEFLGRNDIDDLDALAATTGDKRQKLANKLFAEIQGLPAK